MRLRNLIPCNAKLSLYKSSILSHLTYCHLIWHFSNASDRRKLERIQKRALRAVFNARSVSYQELPDRAKLPTLYNRRLQDIATLMFKVHLTPKYFFRLNNSLHLFETHCAFFSIFSPNLDFLQAEEVKKSGHDLFHDRESKAYGSIPGSISYLESSFLTAHGLTKRTTLERSVREAVLIGCSKTMQMTGSKSEIQYGGQNATKNCLQAWTVNVCKCCNNFVFESNTLLTFTGQRWRRNQFYFCCRGLNDMTNGWISSNYSKVMPSLTRQEYEDCEAARCLHVLQHNNSQWLGLKSVKLYAKVLHKKTPCVWWSR